VNSPAFVEHAELAKDVTAHLDQPHLKGCARLVSRGRANEMAARLQDLQEIIGVRASPRRIDFYLDRLAFGRWIGRRSQAQDNHRKGAGQKHLPRLT
jgi:hypothetical protein